MPHAHVSQAVEEIQAIIKKHDLAGVVFVSSPDNLQYLYEVAPSWSCAFFENGEGGPVLRIRSKREDYPSKDAQKKSLEATVGTFMGLIDAIEGTRSGFLTLIAKIADHLSEIKHSTRREPDAEQS